MTITFKGGPMTLSGGPLQVGDTMPDFAHVDQAFRLSIAAKWGYGHFSPFHLWTPGFVTRRCGGSTRRRLSSRGVSIYAVSLDLPFSQARWCGAAGVERVRTLSDYKDHSFGADTGTRIEELGLLTRAVFVVAGDGLAAYVEYVPEVSDHPNYDKVLAHLRTLFDK